MPGCKRNVVLAAAIAGLLTTTALAQSTSAPTPPAKPAPATEATPGGMMMQGRGMMSQGMMGQDMMGRGMMGQGGMGMMGSMMGAGHVEGRIAFLKTELRITDAQQKPWDAVAAAMRANAETMTAMGGAMTATAAAASLPDRIAAGEKLLNARLDALHHYKAAVDPLYAALSAEQKKTADELMPGMMGMGMGRGMMGRMGMR